MTDEFDSPGQYHHTTILQAHDKAGKRFECGPEYIRESAKRFMEEAVELALACNLSPAEVLLHVTDALHSEAKKANVYPSGYISSYNATNSNRIVEIADVEICIDVIRYASVIPREQIDQHKREKLELLRLRVRDGAYQIVGKRIYKKDR